jgi:hypothetical protein
MQTIKGTKFFVFLTKKMQAKQKQSKRLSVRDSPCRNLFSPRQRRQKKYLIVRVKHQLGTPRGRYEEHSSKFPLVVKPKFIEPVGESQTLEGDAC